MIIRKPYAFLIKNFRKVHVFLFLLCAFIYYKMFQILGFVNQFMELMSYDSYNEPISKYISLLVFLSLIIIIITNIFLALLLKHKNKPWKFYLLPIIVYFGMLFVFVWTTGFFNSYLGDTETTNIRMIHDLLFILSILQYPVFLILFIRIFGVDLKKFNFNQDQEYLELSSEDREEFEINIDIDKESFRRGYKRLLRNINYFYQEHKLICKTVVVIIMLIVARNMYIYFFITNRSYKQGDTLNDNGYSITINKSYYTDKNYAGNIITKNKGFVIIDMTIKNNGDARIFNLDNFRVINGVNKYNNNTKLYALDFEDLGKTMDSVQELKRDQSINLIEIFRVDNKLAINKFVLYLQELDGDQHLRKIKLNVEDLSKIKKDKTVSLGDTLDFTYNGLEESLSFEQIAFLDKVNYTSRACSTTTCTNNEKTINAKEKHKILKLTYASVELDSKKMVDFTVNYGKLRYKDEKNKSKTINITNAVKEKYYGKFLYISVPEEVENARKIDIIYTIRNKQYTYNLVTAE